MRWLGSRTFASSILYLSPEHGGKAGPTKLLWGRLLIGGGLLIRRRDAAASSRSAEFFQAPGRRIANPPQVANLPHKRFLAVPLDNY